jgi:hypothetical protein
MSQYGQFNTTGSGAAVVETLTGNLGLPVGPDVAFNIDLVGSANITSTGDPVTNTITFNLTGTTDHAVQLGNTGGSLTSLGVLSDGYLIIGRTGLDPLPATLTQGTNITITQGVGSITIAASGTPLIPTYTAIDDTDSPYTVLATDYYISVDSSGGPVSILLPNAPTTNRTFIIKDRTGSGSTNAITITTVGGVVLLDGAVNQVMNVDYESMNLMFNSVSYEIY